MLLLAIFHDYFVWHYSRAFKELFGLWKNFLWFVTHFFSLPQLTRTFFAPFKRIQERRKRGFDIEDWLGVFLVNIISRLIGALLRSVLITVGLLCWLLTALVGGMIFLLWVVLPVIVLVGVFGGVTLLFI